MLKKIRYKKEEILKKIIRKKNDNTFTTNLNIIGNFRKKRKKLGLKKVL